MSEAADGLSIAGVLGGSVTLLGLFGGGIKWLFGRAERREQALDAKEAEYVSELKKAIKEQGERIEALELDCRKLWMVIGYVVPALHSHDPKSPALTQAAKILGDAFPIDLNTPKDMTETLNKIG